MCAGRKRGMAVKYGFGVDIGGTTVKMGLFSLADGLLESWEIPTNTAHGGSAILPEIARSIRQCRETHRISPADVFGIGVGVPGPVDQKGVVDHCINLGWGIVDLPAALGGLTGLPVVAGNDANVAALGEYWAGGGQGCGSMVMVTLGTGIGSGIVIDGNILPGAHGAGGEIGHMPMNPEEAEPCGCGNRGCAEQYGSANGLARMARQCLSECETPSRLRALPSITAKDVFALAGDDPLAARLLDDYFRFLGRFLASVCCVVDPEIVVLGGGVSKAGQPLLDGVARYFREAVFHPCRDTRFALARLGNSAGIWGGMYLAKRSFLQG